MKWAALTLPTVLFEKLRFKKYAAALVILSGSASLMPANAEALHQYFSAYSVGATATVDHSAWDALLGKYVVGGEDGLNRVAYGPFKSESHGKLKAYVAALEQVDVATLDKPEQFAFWANLYNAKTIDIVLEHYPVKSIKDIRLGGSFTSLITGGPWKSKVVKVASKSLSLDDIEHGILRKVFQDPRVHYAVNCASIGCPNLANKAFTGAILETQLNDAARAYINSQRGFQVTKGKVKVSSIYKWFQEDFGDNEVGVLQHARLYANDQLKADLKSLSTISSYDYDWGLNDAK